jgi:multidrug efflux pump subunit AcrB
MNKLIEYFAKQGIFVDLITVFVFVLGIFSLLSIRREVFPNISFDVITIVTPYPGASAESSERLISSPLELDLKEVDGIKKITSISREGGSTIILQLDPDQTTADEAKDDVQEVVDGFQELPEGAEDPIVTVAESKLQPVLEIALVGSTVTEEQMRETAKFLERKLELLGEVAKVEFNGLRDYEIRVEAHPEKLQRYRVSLQEIINAMNTRNVSIPGGTIEAAKNNGYQEMIVRTVGEYETAEDAGATVIRANAFAEPIRIRDVATVTKVLEEADRYYRVNASHSISLTVLKKEKADVINLVDNVKQQMEQLKPQINPDIAVTYINDSSFYVRRRISVLANNLLVGLGLVLLILSMILPWRVAAITAFGIPFSFFGALAAFYGFDISINLISMMGLIIVVGMLVDDAIVVTENAQRWREKGMSSMDAAIAGTKQIWAPVTVSVLTTMMAFAPLLFMSGIFGKFVRYIPMGVIIALGISLWECFFVLPHHLGRWIKDRESTPGSQRKGVFTRIWESTMEPLYAYVVRLVVRFRYLVLLAATGLLVGSAVFAVKKMDFILFPPGGVEVFQINFAAPNGSSLEYTLRKAKPIEQGLVDYERDVIDDFVLKVGEQRMGANDPNSKIGSEYGQAIVYLSPATEREIQAGDVIAELREQIGTPEGLDKVSFEQVSGGPPVGKPVDIGVRGKDYDDIMPVVKKIIAELKQIEGVTDLENSFVIGKKEIQIRLNDSEAAAAGLTMRTVGTAVRAAFEGVVATTIRQLDEEIDVRVSLTQKDRSSVAALDQIDVSNNRGQLVPLNRVTSQETTQGISVYRHEGNQRQVSVLAEVNTEITTSQEVNAKMRALMSQITEGHPDISIHFGGENEDTQESLQSLAKAFAFAVFGIILILILLFKNLYQPAIVGATIPLGFIGVIWTFFVHGKPLSFLGMIGIIALAGVIVNNAIVLVDFVNQLKAEGQDRFEAVRQAARIRLRPIFLTTVTTSAGILPTAYGWGGLDPFVVPIALSLGWGMVFGAFLTTLVVPALLVIVDDILQLLRRIFRSKRGASVTH